MATLREQLAGLRSLQVPPGTLSATQPSPAMLAANRTNSGYSVTEEIIPLTKRPGLGDLPGADPQLAAVLIRTPQASIAPVTRWVFLDLETTGLAGGTGTYAFLVGVGQLTCGGFHIRQFFLRDLAAEAALLAEVVSLLREAAVLVTYNGKLFDAPLLDTRFRLGRIAFDFHTLFHLDLLYPARWLWRRRWASLRLADLEDRVLGYRRPEDVPGKLIPQLYFDYLRGGDERPLQSVFRHNTEDLVTLAGLAARMLRLAAAPETASAEPLERFGLARLFERARQLDRAGILYEKALAAGLPEEIERAARWRLAFLCKRRRQYDRAVQLWQELGASARGHPTRETVQAFEELAICYEHRLGDAEVATEITERALQELNRLLGQCPEDRLRYRRAQERFLHRLGRLVRKRARAPFWDSLSVQR